MRPARVLLVVLLPLILVAAGLYAWRWQNRGPQRPSVGNAIDRFRTSSTLPAANGVLVPRPGVYVYDGSGSESLSFLTTHQTQGPTEPGTVVQLPNDCWTFRIDFNSFHSQTWKRCSTATKITESGTTTDQRFDFVAFKMGEHSVVTCDPPVVLAATNVAPGTRAPASCKGRSETTKSSFTQTGTSTFVGRENVSVGGTDVPALHVREDLKMKGDQNGETHIDLWLAVKDGLPLRETHTIQIVSPAPAPLNHVTYTERGNWHLHSLTPRT